MRKGYFEKAFKTILVFCVLTILIILGQAFYFYLIISKNDALEKADVIIVFSGEAERTETGYKLANSDYAPYLVISPVTPDKLKDYDKKYSLPVSVKHVIEDKARTTFENAYYTWRIIIDHQFDSVILVTSFYHLPRSYFLLRGLLIGSNVKIKACGTSIGTLNGKNWLRSSVGRKIVYNEMVKFWASLLELLSYKLTGSLPEKNPKKLSLLKYMRSLFLLDVRLPQRNLPSTS